MKKDAFRGKEGAVLIVIAAILASSFLPSAAADFACSVKASCTGDESEIFSMSGTGNAHAEIASETHYGSHVCCGGMGSGVLGTSCSGKYAVALVLSSDTNAHAGNPLVSPYSVDVCLSTTIGAPWCLVESDACTAGSVCLASISSDTNAHAGDCNAYARKVCCFVNRPPAVTDIAPPPGDNRGDITFAATASDPDGDGVRSVDFEVVFTGGSTALGEDTSAPFQATWNSFDDVVGVIDTTVKVRARASDGAAWGPWYEETFTVNNTRPAAWLTTPSNGTRTGKIFNVTWNGNVYANAYDFQYVDRAVFRAGGSWTTVPQTAQKYSQVNLATADDEAEYCFRVRGADTVQGVPGLWSCNPSLGQDPSTSGCTCIIMDTVNPIAAVDTSPLYTRFGIFDVNWSGSDTGGSGIGCYIIQYRVYDNKVGTEFVAWKEWSSVNNANRLVFSGGGCSAVSCTTWVDDEFNRGSELPLEVRSKDGQTTQFRILAVDNAYGCANSGIYAQSATETNYDTTSPPGLTVVARDADGTVLPSPTGTLYTPDSATFAVSADPADDDYTGVYRTGVRYWLLKPGAGYVVMSRLDGLEMNCGNYVSECSLAAGPWYKDYNVTYKGFAVDRAGNENITLSRSFLVLKPMKLDADTDNVYMTLGSNRIVTLTISNRQAFGDTIKIVLTGYPHAKFMNESVGVPGPGARDLNVTLLPRESKTVNVAVYTSDVGEDYMLSIIANTTRVGFESKIEDMALIDVRVVMPHEFPGLAPWAVALITVSAVVIYAVFSGRRPRN
jgi:hypothetical protein